MNGDEAHPRHHRCPGVLRAAGGGPGPRDDGGRRDHDHRSGGRLELQHVERRVRRGPQGVRPGVRQSGRAAGAALERRHVVCAGELEARRSAKLEAHALCGEQGESDGHTPLGERAAHHRDQDGLGRVLMRLVPGAVLVAALFGCRPTAPPPPPGGFTLLFLDRSPAASLGGLSWAPDPEHGRLLAFDRELRVTRRITHPRLATPMAVTPLGRTELLVTERTGAGVVVDTAGGRGGAVAVGPDGAVYSAPLVRDEIRKYTPGGQVSWTTKRGLFRNEPDPEFLPAKGAELRLKKALVNVALALGPPPPPPPAGGRVYALGSDDSAATRLRVDVLDAATGAILATRHLGPRETAVAVDASGAL